VKLTSKTLFITSGGSRIRRSLAEAFHKLGNKGIPAGIADSPLGAPLSDSPKSRFTTTTQTRKIDMKTQIA